MKLYEVKALAHETQSRIRQDLNAWNDFLEHASRVYRYRFMDQILIYAQRPDAVACATMNIWNSKMGCWIKKGNRGIALIDESNSRKLKYVWDVTSVVPKMGGHLPRLWIRKPYHTETIQNRLLKVYGLQPQTDKYDTKQPSIEHTMDYLVEYLADEYAADIAQEKYSSDNSPLSELDEEKYKMDEYRRNVRVFFRYGLNRMIKERMGLSTGGFSDFDMSFIKDLPESDFCELSSRMTDAAQQALREVGIAVLTYDRVHGIDRDPNVDYNALKRKSAEREDETYGTRIHQSRGLRDTEPYTEPRTTGTADEIRTYAQDLAQKELQGEVRYDADVRGTSGTLPEGTEESTGRDGQNRAADEKTGRGDRAAEDAGPAEMDTNDEQHPEQGRGNSEGYSDLHFVENEIVPESGTDEDEYVPESGTDEDEYVPESGTDEDEYVPESGTGLYFIPELPTEDEQRIKVDKYGYLNPQSTDKYKSEAPEQLSFTDLTNIEPDKAENDTQPEALNETEAEQKDNAEQQNNEDFTERAADYTALLVLAEADASTLTKRQKAQRNISALKILKQTENEKRSATADERTIMSAYLGWGGIPEIFDAENASWSEEYGILKSLLTTTEYDSARASTLNAHFTDTAVINAMYDVLHNLGFTKGNILEPSMGIGNFFAGLPADMNASKLYGVELDPVTGKMAQLIYPDAHIEVKGYEKTDFQNDFFDVAIGNVPFGQYKVLDKSYDKHNFYIHDYFFAKTIDKVRPGGVIAFITSKGTMDKANPSVRRYIAQRAQLLGAIRLPNDAFKNAGTSVTSDIIFLKKRDMYIDTDEDWIHLGTDENGIEMNSYFVNNPHMVLGKMEMVSGPHGMESACVPESGTSLADRLRQAVQMIRGEISIDDTEISDEELEDESIPAEAGVKNFSYCSFNGKIYYRENSIMRPQDIPEKTAERMKGLIDVRDSVSELIELQLDDASDEEIRASQARLNNVYDSFVKKFGYLNSRTNQTAFREDAGYSLISSLEETDDDGKVAGKADMFTKRTIRKAVPVTHVDTSVEALSVSMGEKAAVDLEYMEGLTGKSQEKIISDLKGIIFKVPESGTWQTSEEYLSGNIRKKLISAEKALKEDASYSDNVEYLKKAMPKPLTASEIEVRLGATWINAEYIEQFMKDVLHTPQRLFSREWVAVKFAPINCEWNIKGKNADSYNPLVTGTYGTGRINAYQILENTLNLKDVKVYDRILQPDGSEKRVINREQTMLASQKQDALKEAFKDWIFRDPERREVLVKKYNELFNSSRPRTYDGSHLKFPGMTPDVELKPHQLNAVAHVMYGDNTLLAHCVGAGKTFEMIASAMESKRLGLCHKSLFVVPNHLTEQWAGDFLRLYPGANILAATEKDFEPARRKRFCARIATGDYDAVIIGHTQFAKIPLSDERQKRLMQEQIDEITESISEAKASNGEHFTIKQMEKTKKNLEVRLAKLNDAGKKDNAVTFEQLGVDRLFVDESQEFKNLFLFTKMRNVAGISQNDSQKASDMYGKCRYIDEITGGRGITFATGTPISNSMTELYTNMRYLQAGRLKELGFENFDAWASTFGETQTAIELAPEGTGYRAKTRFAKFFNLPELISLFKESADIQTADMLKLPVPECDYENVVLKPSVFQQDIVKSLGDRAENIRNGGVDSSIDNMLKVTSDGRKCAIDQRLINPELPDNENSKVNACAARAYDIWKETAEDRSTQLIFCDASTPRSDGGFDVYHAIKDKLIAKGVPDKEIAFIHDANTKKQKAELFSKVRSGQVRFLLGSTAKMGAGTNVQTRLIALHHIDVPWRPSDIEQQEGRILRQGNRNERVKIFRYVTENTFDSYSWQLIENKQKFIGQIMTSKSPVRSCDDVDEAALSYAEVKALATGNPYIKEKMTLDTEVAKLKLLKANFKSQKYRLEDAINKEYPVRIAKLEEKIEGLRQDIITRGSGEILSDGFEIRINGVSYDDKKEGGAALIAAARESKTPERTMIGDYKGFKLYSRFDAFFNLYYIHMQGRCEHTIEMSSDPAGMITRLNNCMAGFEKRLSDVQDALDETRIELETAEKEVTKKFDKEDILSEKLKRLSFLNAQLDADRKETPQNAPQNTQAQRNDIKEKYINI